MPIAKTTVSVVVPTCECRNSLECLLINLACQSIRADEVIVVSCDVGPKPQLAKYPVEGCFDVVWMHSPVASAALQRNIGILRARGEIVVMLDDDIILEDKKFISNVLKTFTIELAAVAVSASMANYASPKRSGISAKVGLYFCKAFFLPQAENGRFTISRYPTVKWTRTRRCIVECAGAAGLIVRAQKLRQFLFDSSLAKRSPFEDVSLTYVMSRKFKILGEPQLTFGHPNADETTLERRSDRLIGYTHFFTRHVFPVEPLRLVPFLWTMVGMSLAATLGSDSNALESFILAAWRYRNGRCFVRMFFGFNEHPEVP